MKNVKLKLGDTVRHKSNLMIYMIVISVPEQHEFSHVRKHEYSCTWITMDGDYKSDYFYDFELIKVETLQ